MWSDLRTMLHDLVRIVRVLSLFRIEINVEFFCVDIIVVKLDVEMSYTKFTDIFSLFKLATTEGEHSAKAPSIQTNSFPYNEYKSCLRYSAFEID